MKAIHSIIETLEHEIEELEKLKIHFDPMGKVVYQNEPYHSANEIDSKIQKKRKAIKCLNDHLNSK